MSGIDFGGRGWWWWFLGNGKPPCLRPWIAVLWGRAGCPLSGVERCPLLGGSKCTISMGRAIGGMEFVRCTEVVHLSESPLLEVSL